MRRPRVHKARSRSSIRRRGDRDFAAPEPTPPTRRAALQGSDCPQPGMGVATARDWRLPPIPDTRLVGQSPCMELATGNRDVFALTTAFTDEVIALAALIAGQP